MTASPSASNSVANPTPRGQPGGGSLERGVSRAAQPKRPVAGHSHPRRQRTRKPGAKARKKTRKTCPRQHPRHGRGETTKERVIHRRLKKLEIREKNVWAKTTRPRQLTPSARAPSPPSISFQAPFACSRTLFKHLLSPRRRAPLTRRVPRSRRRGPGGWSRRRRRGAPRGRCRRPAAPLDTPSACERCATRACSALGWGPQTASAAAIHTPAPPLLTATTATARTIIMRI
jgi:hypothetical protein